MLLPPFAVGVLELYAVGITVTVAVLGGEGRRTRNESPGRGPGLLLAESAAYCPPRITGILLSPKMITFAFGDSASFSAASMPFHWMRIGDIPWETVI